MPYTDHNFSNFIPEIWSKKLLIDFEKSMVMRSVCNTDYEGEISAYGDSVKIRGTGSVTVNPYTRGMDLVATQSDPTLTTLTIDQAYYFMFEVDDLDRAQMDLSYITLYSQKSAYMMRKNLDTLLLSSYVDATSSVGTDLAPIDLASASVDVYEQIVDISTKLDDQDVSPDGRWLIVPPRVAAVIQKHAYFADASKAGDGGFGRRTGYIGQIAGMDILKSTNLVDVAPASSSLAPHIFPCLAGTNDAITFAMQVSEVEAVRPSNKFLTYVKGLVLFGFKTLHPQCLCSFKVKASTI